MKNILLYLRLSNAIVTAIVLFILPIDSSHSEDNLFAKQNKFARELLQRSDERLREVNKNVFSTNGITGLYISQKEGKCMNFRPSADRLGGTVEFFKLVDGRCVGPLPPMLGERYTISNVGSFPTVKHSNATLSIEGVDYWMSYAPPKIGMVRKPNRIFFGSPEDADEVYNKSNPDLIRWDFSLFKYEHYQTSAPSVNSSQEPIGIPAPSVKDDSDWMVNAYRRSTIEADRFHQQWTSEAARKCAITGGVCY